MAEKTFRDYIKTWTEENESGYLMGVNQGGDPVKIDKNTLKPQNSPFVEVKANSSKVVKVDYSKTPNAIIDLKDNYTLSIENFDNKTVGNILIKQTVGNRYLTIPTGSQGDFNVQVEQGATTLITYYVIEGVINFTSSDVIRPIPFDVPSQIQNLTVDYIDGEQAIISFDAPSGNSPTEPVDFYELAVAEFPINDLSAFNAATLVNNLPTPSTPNQRETAFITDLRPAKQYYISIRGIKINYGVRYAGAITTGTTFTTGNFEDSLTPLRIPLYESSVIDYIDFSTAGRESKNIVDIGNTTFGANGYPATLKSSGSYFDQDYQVKKELPYQVQLDLKAQFEISRLYFQRYTYSSTNNITLEVKENENSPWESAGVLGNAGSSNWNYVTLNRKARYLRLVWDTSLSYSTEEEDNNTLSETLQDYSFAALYCIIPYGKLVSGSIDDNYLLPQKKNLRTPVTFDEFVGTNILPNAPISLMRPVTGSRVRVYSNATWFTGEDLNYINLDGGTMPVRNPTGITDVDFYFSNSHIFNFDTFYQAMSDEGFKIMACTQGSMFFNTMKLQDVSQNIYSVLNYKPNDEALLDGVYPPHTGDNSEYMSSYQDPNNYRSMAALAFELVRRYGTVTGDTSTRLGTTRNGVAETFKSGLDTIGYYEPQNEPDRNWNGRYGYFRPEELAALISATYDGHCNTLEDEEGSKNFGVKNADPNFVYVLPGLAFGKVSYFKAMVNWWRGNRPDSSMPFDVFNFHHYSSNTGGQGYDPLATAVSIEFDEYAEEGGEIAAILDYRDRYFPDKEVWLSEWGVAEHGKSDELGGRIFAAPNLGSYHKGFVKAAWLIRGLVWFYAMGMDTLNLYWFEDSDSNYIDYEPKYWEFGTGTYSELADYNGYKFATMGLTAGLYNAYYPIKPSYFYIATLRDTLKDMVFVKWIDNDNPYIYIASFVKSDGSNQGVYVVWSATPYALDNPTLTEYSNESIDLPNGVTQASKRNFYVPDFPNPYEDPLDDLHVTKNVGIYSPAGQKMNATSADRQAQLAAYETFFESNEGKQSLTGTTENLTLDGTTITLDKVSEFPTLIEFTGGRDYPDAGDITDLQAKAISDNSIELKFNNYKTTDESFDVFINTSSTGLTFYDNYETSENRITIYGLDSGVQYYFRVRAKAGSSTGELSNIASAITNKTVPNPTNFEADDITSNSVSFTWDYVTGNTQHTGFVLQRSSSLSGTYTNIASIPASGRTYTDTGLQHLTQYFYKLKATGSLGDSNFTGVVATTTKDITQEPPLMVAAYTANDGSYINLEFNVEMNPTTYAQGFTIFQYVSGSTGSGNFHTIDDIEVIDDSTYRLNLDSNLLEPTSGGTIVLDYEVLSGYEVSSNFGFNLEAISGRTVTNYVGAAIGFISRTKLSFRASTDQIYDAGSKPVDVAPPSDWNDINYDPAAGGNITFNLSGDTGQPSSLSLYYPPVLREPGGGEFVRTEDMGYDASNQTLYPESVTIGSWVATSYNTGYYGTLIIKGLASDRKLDITIYSSEEFGGGTGKEVTVVANNKSVVFNWYQKSTPEKLTEVLPDENGEVRIELRNLADFTKAVPINFLILEEFENE
jgi:hypothetical protein